jgi:tetratricopeptide (TPR) repeat protein
VFNDIHRYSPSITVMSKNIFISGLTFISVLLGTINNAHAALTFSADTIGIVQAGTKESNNSTTADRSMKYVDLGIAAQKRGQDRQALLYYHQALKIDETNAYAFMGAATLLGATEEGIACMKAAATLFQEQDNQEGFEVAINWLNEATK